ncbi:MAG: hypothetical protein AVDCRST_MAG75-1084 [uncultured Propionibacteriaceae bacterium]|uniref:Uncharacterized protein n=1 Tax=uncultured Propionibacteriaceae bacterium TaxID=257457 RepID=A0A6J4NEG3_9ACTN|nr:MAG: hypothetical protein AVDCRST_MAG75-1084 [uncultured Propionibacteriaceae bacterium]
MPRASRTEAFLAFADAHRRALLGSAYLILGDAALARARVDFILAKAYQSWRRLGDPRMHCFAALLGGSNPGPQPWNQSDRYELVDRHPAPPEPAEEIVSDLADLGEQERQLVVLEYYAGMSPAELAVLTSADPDRVEELRAAARSALTARNLGRSQDRHLEAELEAAVQHRFGPELSNASGRGAAAGQGAADDLSHGRSLVHRQRLRGLAAAVLVVVLALGASQALPSRGQPEAAGASPPVASASPSRPSCPVSDRGCRGQVTRDWRDRISKISRSYLDPDDSYFTGYSYSYDRSYDSDELWNGQGGALGLDLFKLERGATQVFIQVATAREFAPRCGQATAQDCVSMRFMDGNSFIMTETTHVSEGIEVQYRPEGTQVITLIARNVSNGTALDITRGQLLLLAQDPQLRLPPL